MNVIIEIILVFLAAWSTGALARIAGVLILIERHQKEIVLMHTLQGAAGAENRDKLIASMRASGVDTTDLEQTESNA